MISGKHQKSIKNWIAGSDYDLETAKHMLATGRYIYVVFMCHLALEKMLKAHVELQEDKTPPKVHHLKTLADRSGVKIPNDFKKIILELNETSIPTRYPEELQSSLAVFTNEYCERILLKTEETLRWLKSRPRFSALLQSTSGH